MIALPSHRGIRQFLFSLTGVLFVLCLLAPITQAQSLPLYVVHHNSNNIETVDPLTGNLLTSTPIVQSGEGVTGGFWGLAKHPATGTLFAIWRRTELVTINPSTGEMTDIGPTGHNVGGITFRKASGGAVSLYMVSGHSDATNPDTLFTLDTTSGAATLVLAFGNGNMGETIAFNTSDGFLYRMYGSGLINDSQFLNKIDPVSLAVTNIPLSHDTYNQATALTYWAGNFLLMADHNSNLFLVSTDGRVKDLSFLSTGGGDDKGMVFGSSPPVCPLLAPLYGAANIGPTGPSLLYSLDPSSGAPTLIGPIGFERVGGMRFNSAGVLFGAGSRQDISSVTEGGPSAVETQVLITINPCTGAGTQIGNMGIEGLGFSATTDISFRHSDGVLFSLVGGPLTLGTLNTSTGHFTSVGPLGIGFPNGNGIAFSPNDTLYQADNNVLNQLSPTNGVATLIVNLTYPTGVGSNFRVNAMDFQPGTGILYGSVTGVDSGDNQENFLATINTTTGVVTFFTAPVGPAKTQEVPGAPAQTQLGLDAIAFSPRPPASIATTGGTPQKATVTTAFAQKLQATVKDSGGNPVSNVTVTFTPPASGASGTFSGGNTAVTNSSGVATSNTFTANGTSGGPYVVHGTFASPAEAGTSSTPLDAPFSLTNVDYNVTPVTITKTVSAGGTADYNLNFIAIVGNTTDSTTLSCQNLPSLASCLFNPATFPANSGNAPFTLAISTTAPHTSSNIGTGNRLNYPGVNSLRPGLLVLFAMLAVSMALFFTRTYKQTRARLSAIGVFAALLLFAGCFAGCGGLGTGFPAQTILPGTPAGNYNVTVVATSGPVQRTTTVTLVVQ